MLPSTQARPGVLICLLSACISLSVIAGPQDMLESQSLDMNSIDQSTGEVLSYLNIAGAAFHPYDSSTSYSYTGGGCIAKTGGEPIFTHKVILPSDVLVRYVRLYYNDTSSMNVIAFLLTFDGGGNYTQRTSVSSAIGPTGFGSVLSPDINFTTDHYTSAMNIVINLGDQNDETLRFCGVRIAYNAPASDRIFANGFELIQL